MISKTSICILVVLLLGVVATKDPFVQVECQCSQKGSFFDYFYNTCGMPPSEVIQDACLFYQQMLHPYTTFSYRCLKCEEPFAIEIRTGRCVAQKNCLKYDPRQKECVECREGYYLNNFPHSQCSRNPQQGDVDFIQGCDQYYLNKRDQLNCAQCSEYGQVSINQTCVQASSIIPNCVEADVDFNCLVCKYGYSPNQNGCHKNPSEKQSIFVENCEVYQFKNYPVECKECEEGFVFVPKQNICKKIEHVVENCVEYICDRDNKNCVCNECASDFFLPYRTNECQKCQYAEFIQF